MQTTKKEKMRSADLAKIANTGEKLRLLQQELTQIFPERRHLITQIVYGLVCKEHVLILGTYGTGKSDLVHTLFGCITGGKLFSTALSKFMTESHIIGLPDPKVMKEQGQVIYKTDGGILDADFAELDELLDSNTPLLRVLLGILNERLFKRGRQVEIARLQTAVASTNADPETEIKRDPGLGAVIDRFLFHCNVQYLQTSESRRRMYEKFLRGETPSVRVSLDELKLFSDAVVGANQITDPFFIETYDTIIEEYCGKRKVKTPISDRRKCKLLQLIEANALLYGRYEVLFDDIMAVRWGICRGGDDGEHDLFKETATPLIEEAKQKHQQNVGEIENKLLRELEAKIVDPIIGTSDADLVKIRRNMLQLCNEIESIAPLTGTTEDIKRKALAKVRENLTKIQALIDNAPEQKEVK